MQRIRVAPVTDGLGEHRELDAVGVIAKSAISFDAARLLLAEVVRREAQHHQALLLYLAYSFSRPSYCLV